MLHSKKLLLIFILPLFLLFTGCSDNSTTNPTPTNEPASSQSVGFIDIKLNNLKQGEIPMSKGKIDIPFTFYNGGKEPVTLLTGRTSCMCTEAVVKNADGTVSPPLTFHGALAQINQVVKPGEEATLLAIYDPLAHGPDATGPIKRDIIIQTNSTRTPEIKFSFQGNVVK